MTSIRTEKQLLILANLIFCFALSNFRDFLVCSWVINLWENLSLIFLLRQLSFYSSVLFPIMVDTVGIDLYGLLCCGFMYCSYRLFTSPDRWTLNTCQTAELAYYFAILILSETDFKVWSPIFWIVTFMASLFNWCAKAISFSIA